MISYLFGIYCISETVVRESAGFWTIIAQFSTCHNLAIAAVYWLVSLIDFSRLIGLFSNADFHSRDDYFCHYCHTFPLYFQQYSNILPVHFCFIFNNISFNIQWIFILIVEFKLSILFLMYCSIVKTELICFLCSVLTACRSLLTIQVPGP